MRTCVRERACRGVLRASALEAKGRATGFVNTWKHALCSPPEYHEVL
jgi:hypothetical protein